MEAHRLRSEPWRQLSGGAGRAGEAGQPWRHTGHRNRRVEGPPERTVDVMSLPYIIAQTRLDSHVPSYMRPAGAPAGGEAVLGWALTIIAVAVTVVIAILLVVAVLRKREDPDSTTTRNASDGTYRVRLVPGLSWIYVGLAITVVILLGTFSATVVSLANSAHAPSRPKITMDIIAHQWWWEVRMEDTVP